MKDDLGTASDSLPGADEAEQAVEAVSVFQLKYVTLLSEVVWSCCYPQHLVVLHLS